MPVLIRVLRGTRKRYTGYRSFQSLEPGTDYTEFKLATEIDRVNSRVVELSSEQPARAQRLLDDSLIMLIRAETTEDVVRARQNGQIAFIPSLQAATPIENELDRMHPGPQSVYQLT